MRIAVPLTNGEVTLHFGHCENFAFFDVEPAGRSIHSTSKIEAPEHKPGLLPGWLKQRGVTVVIARSIGSHARSLFEDASIEVVTGAQQGSARAIAEMYLAGTLTVGPNGCDH